MSVPSPDFMNICRFGRRLLVNAQFRQLRIRTGAGGAGVLTGLVAHDELCGGVRESPRAQHLTLLFIVYACVCNLLTFSVRGRSRNGA
jgi:hypothetical protein